MCCRRGGLALPARAGTGSFGGQRRTVSFRLAVWHHSASRPIFSIAEWKGRYKRLEWEARAYPLSPQPVRPCGQPARIITRVEECKRRSAHDRTNPRVRRGTLPRDPFRKSARKVNQGTAECSQLPPHTVSNCGLRLASFALASKAPTMRKCPGRSRSDPRGQALLSERILLFWMCANGVEGRPAEERILPCAHGRTSFASQDLSGGWRIVVQYLL